MKLPAFIQTILNMISGSGFEAFVVGGCVRDSILGKIPDDWDITTSARPEDIIQIFSDYFTIPTGLKHGTVTVLADGNPVEVTTYRIDGEYADLRHPQSVSFAQNIDDDLARRDFTINSIAYNKACGFVDLFDGISDLKNRIIRAVGNPDIRFCEDALRIMRALRFATILGFEIEEATSSSILKNCHLLKNIAKERIAAELSKQLMADGGFDIFLKYIVVYSDILDIDKDTLSACWKENITALSRADKVLSIRLAILFDGLDSVKILKNLKFDNKTVKEVKLIDSYLYKPLQPDKTSIKRLLSEIGIDGFSLVLKAKYAKFSESHHILDVLNNLLTEIIDADECYSLSTLDIDGNDIKKSLAIDGKNIGKVLNRLLDAVICDKCENKKEMLLSYAKQHLI